MSTHAEWMRSVRPGTEVCDCRFEHHRVAQIDGDDVVLDDGMRCSLAHCLDPVPHDFQHPEGL